jgi:4-amino-4-deoxy-L-arabinose transferase-like glycosyltransferase
MTLNNWMPRLRSLDQWLILIVLLAALFRFYQPGLYDLWFDEIIVQDMSIRMARQGDFTWVGNRSQFAGLDVHSPFTTYVMSLAYLFSPDPQVGRLFIAIFGLAAVVAMYYVMKHYFGRSAALWSALFVALFPLAIDHSRWVLNPNLSPVFTILWIGSGLHGYYEGNRHSQIAHWLFLSAVIQAQTALLIILPLSLLLVFYRWRIEPEQRKQIIKTTLLALALTAVTFIPWAIGIVGIKQGWLALPGLPINEGSSNPIISLPDWGMVWGGFSALAGGANFRLNTMNLSEARADWWPPLWLNLVFQAQAVLILLIIAWSSVQAYRKRHEAIPIVFISLVALWPLLYYLLAKTKVLSLMYMMPVSYAALALLGVGISELLKRYRILLIVPLIFLAADLWVMSAYLNWYQVNPGLLSLSEMQGLVREWVDEGGEVIMLDNPDDESQFTRFEWQLYWRILAEQYPLRTVEHLHAFPIAPDGISLVAPDYDPTIPTLFAEGEIVPDFQRQFRHIVLTPDDLPPVNFVPTSEAVFGDLLTLQGVIAAEAQAGELWNLIIIWQPLRVADSQYQFSLRLSDREGTRYGQVDGEALQTTIWRAGDTVVTQFQMRVAEEWSTDAGLHLQVLVYSWPAMDNVPLADSSGEILTLITPVE